MNTAREVYIHREAWLQTFKDWQVVDCAIRDRNIVYVVLRKAIPPDEVTRFWDHEIPTRFVAIYLNERAPEARLGHQGLTGFAHPVCSVAQSPVPQGIVLSCNGDALAMGSGLKDLEKVPSPGERVALHKARRIDGRTYAVGMLRDVYRRVDVGKWERLATGLPVLSREEISADETLDLGFRDIDGFSEREIYAVGGRGDVWRFDGRKWTACELSTNWPVSTVCCAGDGVVYIGGEGGHVFSGRGDRWRRVVEQDYTVPYNDIVWYDGKLWLSSDFALDQLVDGMIAAAADRGRRVPARGHMDATDGVLVVAAIDHVQMLDGGGWRTLVWPYR